jgi:glycosyltransferase involved in cell wall biosynthesis
MTAYPARFQSKRGVRGLSIVFVVPRFHTNLFHAVSALTDAGHIVNLVCVRRERAEDHTVVQPTYVSPKTPIPTIIRMLRDFAPDLLFIRKVPPLSRRFFVASIFLGIRAFAYDQSPVHMRRSMRKIAFDLVRGVPVRRITPVLGLDRSTPPDSASLYLPFPVDATPARDRSYAPGGVVRILSVGKLGQSRKNHHVLIDALAKLQNVGSFSLTIVGASVPGADSLLQQVQDRGLAGRTRILADLPFSEMAAVYRAHDVCVLASSREPLGTAPLEGMAYGCVPIISDECGSAGYVFGENCGFIVKAGVVESLRDTFRTLLSHPEKVHELGMRARTVAEKKFNKQLFVQRVESLISARPKTQ